MIRSKNPAPLSRSSPDPLVRPNRLHTRAAPRKRPEFASNEEKVDSTSSSDEDDSYSMASGAGTRNAAPRYIPPPVLPAKAVEERRF